MSDDVQVADQQVLAAPVLRSLAGGAFHQLAAAPPALTWFANIDTPQTCLAFKNGVEELVRYAGIAAPLAFRDVARAHVPGWHRDTELRSFGWRYHPPQACGRVVAVRIAVRSQLYPGLPGR